MYSYIPVDGQQLRPFRSVAEAFRNGGTVGWWVQHETTAVGGGITVSWYAKVGRHVFMARTNCMVAAPAVGSSLELFSFRAILFFPTHPLLSSGSGTEEKLRPKPATVERRGTIPFTHVYDFILTPGLRCSDVGVFQRWGAGLGCLHTQEGLSCPGVGYAQPSIYISACALVVMYGFTVCEHYFAKFPGVLVLSACLVPSFCIVPFHAFYAYSILSQAWLTAFATPVIHVASHSLFLISYR